MLWVSTDNGNVQSTLCTAAPEFRAGTLELNDEVGVDVGLKGVTGEAVLEVVEDGGGEGVELGMGAVERFRARRSCLAWVDSFHLVTYRCRGNPGVVQSREGSFILGVSEGWAGNV